MEGPGVIEWHGLTGYPSGFQFSENWLVHLLLLLDLSFCPRVLGSNQKANLLALALGGESVSLNLQVSAEKCFLPTPISFSSDLPCQDTCLSFPPSLALLSSCGWSTVQERKAKLSAEFQGQRLYHQDQGANSRPSQHPPVCWGLLCCGIWSFLYHPQAVASALIYCFCICLSIAQGEAPAVLNPLRSASLAHFFLMASLVGRKESRRMGKMNTYLKEKGLGRPSLCMLHSTSLCDH